MSLWPFLVNYRPQTAALAAAIQYRPHQLKVLLPGDKTLATKRRQRPLG
jgi:hypothetical protein